VIDQKPIDRIIDALQERSSVRVKDAMSWADERGITEPSKATVSRAERAEARLIDIRHKKKRKIQSEAVSNAVSEALDESVEDTRNVNEVETVQAEQTADSPVDTFIDPFPLDFCVDVIVDTQNVMQDDAVQDDAVQDDLLSVAQNLKDFLASKLDDLINLDEKK
jgi:hypothetical protein